MRHWLLFQSCCYICYYLSTINVFHLAKDNTVSPICLMGHDMKNVCLMIHDCLFLVVLYKVWFDVSLVKKQNWYIPWKLHTLDRCKAVKNHKIPLNPDQSYSNYPDFFSFLTLLAHSTSVTQNDKQFLKQLSIIVFSIDVYF